MTDAEITGGYEADADGDATSIGVLDIMRARLKEAMVVASQESLEHLRTAIEAAKEIGLETTDLDAATKLFQQLETDAAPFTFTDLPREKMEHMQACTSRADVLAILLPCLRLRLEDGFQSEVLAEFHYHNFMFCQKSGFCTEKASTVISLLRALHTRAIVQEKVEDQKARDFFEAMLAKHSRQLPPYSVGVFTAEDVAAIRKHTEQSFFRHYSMHAFVAHQRQDLEVKLIDQPAAPTQLPFAPTMKRSAADLREAALREAAARDAANSAAQDAAAEAAAAQQQPALTGTEADVHQAVEDALEAHLHRFEPPSL